MQLVPKLKSVGFNAIAFHTIIMRQTLDEIVAIAQMGADMGVNTSFSSYCELKTGSRTRLLQEEEEIKKLEGVIHTLKELKNKYHHIRSSDWYLDHIPEFFRNAGYMKGCKAGSKWVTITPEGYVKPCSELDVMCHYTEWNPNFEVPEEVSQCSKCFYACRGEAMAPFSVKRMVDLVRVA
jgi:MoaA/NifB/PqqE/SkfB family radical SAM enzyme